MIALKLLVLPSLSNISTPNSLSLAVAFSFAPVKLSITVLNVVPACEPFIPASPKAITADTVSSIEKPAELATGAIYFKDSPRVSILTLALLIAYAKASVYLPDSSADIPKAVKLSETMSATVAKSRPEAIVRFNMFGKPAII